MMVDVLATTVVGQVQNGFLARMSSFSPAATIVWLVLAARCDKKSTARPSVNSIQTDSGLSRSVVCRALKELRDAAEIFDVHGGGRYGCKKYRIRTSSDSKLVQKSRLTSSDSELADIISNQTQEPDTSSCRALRFDAADRKTAVWMFGLIEALDRKAKKPNLDRWADVIRLMRQRDGRTDDDIRATFQWANQDDFWQSNILSPAKLREKFSQLSLKMKAGGKGKLSSNFADGPGQRFDPNCKSNTPVIGGF